MEISKRYEILEGLPTYGPMYISVTGDDEPYYSEGFVVRFFTSDGADWVANFKRGWTSMDAIYDYPNTNRTIVFAGGCCYIMNPEDPKPLKTFGFTYKAVLEAEDTTLVAVDDISITVIDSIGDVWDAERISWDGIKDIRLEGEVVSGVSFDPMDDKDEWVPFTLNIRTKEVSGGSYRRYYSSHWGNKPWWKLW